MWHDKAYLSKQDDILDAYDQITGYEEFARTKSKSFTWKMEKAVQYVMAFVVKSGPISAKVS
jgi:hypothetical protein